tara:strand:- start:176 stop:517 length:342 start_codon:yes stop_codon:yes gene_type:complete
MESIKVILTFLISISLLFVSTDNLKRPLTEEQVLRFLILESDLSDRFVLPVKFDVDDKVTNYARKRPIINVYDSLLSFGDFSIDTTHFEAIGLKVVELIEAKQFPDKKIPGWV